MEVEIYIKVDESKVAAYQKLAEDLGDEISITKPIKFEDLGLAPMENGKFQCLACSKILSRKQTAVDHYKKQHTSSTNQFEYKIQCPRCSQEIAKVWILQEAISEKCNSDKLNTFSSQKGTCIVLQVPFCEEKSVQLVRVAFFRSDFLQNPYFRMGTYF